MFTLAITRRPGKNFAQGITTSKLGVPDYPLMLKQHTAYVETLRNLGLEVTVLDALDNFPDAYFVEDTAIVTPELAIITNPGAPARRGEEISIKSCLKQYRKIIHIQPPGTLEGGDVLMIGKTIFIGLSERTNQDGAAQLGHILESQGYIWTNIFLPEGLHLKSSVNYVGKDTVLITEKFFPLPVFQKYNKIVIEKEEDYATNTLLVNDHLITPKGFPSTRMKLSALGFPVIELEISEAQKMDGGLTCMSLRF